MDELNFIENIKHHYMSYGGWSFALNDYWKLNLTKAFDDPKMQLMFDIVDSFEHRSEVDEIRTEYKDNLLFVGVK